MEAKNEKKNKDVILRDLDLIAVLDRDIAMLSGGELQRFAIGVVCVQEADMFVIYVRCFCLQF